MAGRYAEFVVNLNTVGRGDGSGGNKTGGQKMANQSKNNTKSLNKIVGVVARTATIINNGVGQYTGNKIKQQNINQGIKLTAMAITTMVNPAIGIAMLATSTINSAIQYSISIVNSEQESKFRSSLVGKMATSGSRWRGENR